MVRVIFRIGKRNGFARIGKLSIKKKRLETPYFFPVLSFFCGGTQKSYFGGGPYRAIKETYLNGPDTSELFQGVITSISQLYDFNMTEERKKEYFSKTIANWFNYNGVVFVDSGGYRLLSKENSDFERAFRTKKAMRTYILHRQSDFGADIYVPLDFPSSPNLSSGEREKRWRFSFDSHMFSVEHKMNQSLLYAVIHGHDAAEVQKYVSNLEKRLNRRGLDLSIFDGFAIGGLVPIKNNYLRVAEIFNAVRNSISERELSDKPLHMFGLGTLMVPFLTWLGADSFDSLSYLYAAIHRRYLLPNLTTIRIEKLNKAECPCPICSNEISWKIMKNENTKYAYQRVTPLAIHNLWVLQEEVNIIKGIIRDGEDFVKHLTLLASTNSSLQRVIKKLLQATLE
ncbi:MAG: tRNA-guanine transglycosylase [Candidatus Thorarchaeota archaeon]